MNKRVTIQDVASHAGVSRAAVSKVLRGAYGVSDAMRNRVERSIADLDYRPSVSARAMRGSSFTIGIEVPFGANDFMLAVIKSAVEALASTPYQVIVAPAGRHHEGGPQALQMLVDRGVDGLVAVSPAVDQGWLEELAMRVPLVMLGRHDESVGYDTLVNDDERGIELIFDHLRSLGHLDIAHFTIEPANENYSPQAPHAIRGRAYQRLMASAGLEEFSRVVHVEQSTQSVLEVAHTLLQGPDRPSAIIAGHDELAMELLRAAGELGLTREDVAITGYDDTRTASHPLVSLTSVNQSSGDFGARAVSLLLERINGRSEAVHHMVDPELHVRLSTTQRQQP